jgi:hypothetical protein
MPALCERCRGTPFAQACGHRGDLETSEKAKGKDLKEKTGESPG